MEIEKETKKTKIKMFGSLVSVAGTVVGLYSLTISSMNIEQILSINNYYIYFTLVAVLLAFLGYKYGKKFIVSEKTPKYYIFKTLEILLIFPIILKLMLHFIKTEFLFAIFDISTLSAIIPIPFILGEIVALYSNDFFRNDKNKNKIN